MQLIAFIAEGSWPADTRLVAVHCLADFAALGDGALVTKDLASRVVLQLCVHAVSGLKKGKSQVPYKLYTHTHTRCVPQYPPFVALRDGVTAHNT